MDLTLWSLECTRPQPGKHVPGKHVPGTHMPDVRPSRGCFWVLLIATDCFLRLQHMPEVQQLLRRPRLEGITAQPAQLQRFLKAVLLQPEFQRAVSTAEVMMNEPLALLPRF